MRILYHHRTASKDGQAVHIEEMIQALRDLGHEVRVVEPDMGPQQASSELGGEARWVRRLRNSLPKGVYEVMELLYSAVAYRRLFRVAQQFRPDFIYERYNLHLLSGLMLSRRLGIPLLLEVNAPLADERMRFGGLALPRLARWTESRIWRGANLVLPVTKVLAEHVSARGVPGERIVVIPNGINKAHFAAAPSTAEAKATLGWSDAFVLGFTGFVRDWHGVDRVLRWLATDAAPSHAKLLMVGDGPARPALEALARTLGIESKIRFTGVVPRHSVPRFVAAFDIALQPAVVSYASPLKLFEYLALGRAVIGPRQPNLEEVLTHDSNALLFDADAPGGLEAALSRLAGDSALRERLAAAAAATISRLGLTWQANASRVAHLGAAFAANMFSRDPTQPVSRVE